MASDVSEEPDPLSDAEIAEFAAILKRRIAELDAASDGARDQRAPVELDQQSVGRLARMDAMERQAMAKAAEQRRRAERARLDAALARIVDDAFGDCLRCGEPIERARLALDAAIPLCRDCVMGAADR